MWGEISDGVSLSELEKKPLSRLCFHTFNIYGRTAEGRLSPCVNDRIQEVYFLKRFGSVLFFFLPFFLSFFFFFFFFFGAGDRTQDLALARLGSVL